MVYCRDALPENLFLESEENMFIHIENMVQTNHHDFNSFFCENEDCDANIITPTNHNIYQIN